ncbi:unnamed protein product [Pelagomonas calceolata]|uniref:Uncharacterized protein n=1 Tax=Pelagomonas calceolata TaxID=35677 RepID=A0A8J2WFA4_9STRA|nr:unnamed protein product [Pelagomonas calceolata]
MLYKLYATPVDARTSSLSGGQTALHLLCGSNSAHAAMYVQTGERNAETVEACFHLLREAGADLSARDDAGRTPLHHVATCSGARMIPEVHANWQGGCLQLASLLLHHGADVNATDAQSIPGRASPLHEAVFCPAMTALLVKAGADVNLPNRDGRTPLYTAVLYATRWRDERVRGTVPILLRAGAAIIGDVSDHFTWDPADYDFSQGTGLYFQKVIDAGGFKKYEQAHLATLTKTFAPKFPMLPPEMVRHILTFGFHAGFY